MNSNNYNYIKKDKKEYLVITETQEKSGSYYQYKPKLNIKGDFATTINKNIDELFQTFQNENTSITYESSLNGIVLSLLITIEDHSYAESSIVYYFQSYNINLEEMALLSNDKLLSYYNLTEEQADNLIKEKMQEKYNLLVQDNQINKKRCNYNCFIKTKNYTEGINDASLYIKDKKLIAYKPYISITEEVKETPYRYEIVS